MEKIYEKTTKKQLRFGKILSRSTIWTSLGGCLDTRDAIFDTVAGDSQILLKQNHGVLLVDIFDAYQP